MKISVIGNGECVKTKRVGSDIDSCDRVVRINKFVVDGYEEFVGSRLDIYCSKWHKIMFREPEFISRHNEFWFPHPEPPTQWGSPGGTGTITTSQHEQNKNILNINDDKIKFLPTPAIELLDTKFKLAEPSVGIVALVMARYLYPEAEIYVTGFDGLSSGWYWDSTHDCLESCRNSVMLERVFYREYIEQDNVYEF